MASFPYWDIKEEDILPAIKNKQSPIINEILQLLSLTGKLPTFGTSKYTQPMGEYHPGTDHISLSRWTGNNAQVMAHELSHALYDRMGKSAIQWKYNDRTPNQGQFSDAMYKLDRANDFHTTGSSYRDDIQEQKAFGVGNYIDVKPQQDWENATLVPGSQHMDATNATEQAILRSLYLKALQGK